jgi:hypothetical protein
MRSTKGRWWPLFIAWGFALKVAFASKVERLPQKSGGDWHALLFGLDFRHCPTTVLIGSGRLAKHQNDFNDFRSEFVHNFLKACDGFPTLSCSCLL